MTTNQSITQARILLVEDDCTNSFFMLELLATMGITSPLVANNGEEALAFLSGDWPDLVFMDCQMPVMDGFEATRRLRTLEKDRPRRLPVIALTAFAFEEDRLACLQAGMDDFLTKPVKEEALWHTLHLWLADRGFSFPDYTSVPTTQPAVDSPFAYLFEVMGEDGVVTLINTFLAEYPNKLNALYQAKDIGQWEEFVRNAHSLKSNCSIFKRTEMAILCQEMVTLGRSQSPATAANLLPTLEQMAIPTLAMMKNELLRLSPSSPVTEN